MPKVGDKHFAYTEKGKAKAKAAAKKSGAKTITARGSGAARPQKFHVTIGG